MEVPFDTELEIDGETIRISGRLDRVEVDAAGRVRVTDLKTTKTPPSGAELAAHPQLGVYQAVVGAGGLAGALPGAGRTAAAPNL